MTTNEEYRAYAVPPGINDEDATSDGRWQGWALDQEPFDLEPRTRRRKPGPARLGWRWIVAPIAFLAIVVLLVITGVEVANSAEVPRSVSGMERARDAALARLESSRGGGR